MQELKSWLERRFPDSLIEPPYKGNEPPDFWIRCKGIKYAVEITRILHEDHQTVLSSLWRLLGEAEKEARGAGELSGTYVVEFDHPLAGPRGRPEVKRRIRDYVRRTKSQSAAEKEDVRIRDDVICRIQKYSGVGADIFPVNGGVDIGGWEPEIRRELEQILRTCLEAKAGHPAKVNCPTILVLHDLYRMASQATLVESVRDLPQTSVFHTVYVVQEKNVGFVITTSFPSPA